MKKLVPLSLTVVALIAAGCGGSSGSSSTSSTSASTATVKVTTSTTPSSPANFLAQVNSLCAAGNSAIDNLPSSDANTTAGFKAVIAVIKSFVPKFQAIPAPAAYASDYASILTDLSQEVTYGEEEISELAAGNDEQAKIILAKDQAVEDKGDAIDKKLGLTECAASAGPGGAD